MPIDSIYQATKSSIEQGIFQLQQRIRRKNQLQLQRELTDKLLQEEILYRQQKQLLDLQRVYYENSKYNNALLQRTTHDPYTNSILYESSLNDPAQLGYLELKEAIRKENEHLEYLRRLERMKEQSVALNVPKASGYEGPRYEESLLKHSSPIRQLSSNRQSHSQSRGYSSKKSPSKVQSNYRNLQYDLPLEEDSSALLDKYNKGIRAQQYNREMQRLLEIEKRMRRNEQNSASKSYYGQANQSIVTPYLTRYEQNRQIERTKQKLPLISNRQNINEAQRSTVNDQPKTDNYLQSKFPEHRKVEMFQNEKIGQVINKRPEQINDFRPSLNAQRHQGIDRFDNQIKNPQARNPILKPVSIGRPSTGKPRNSSKREVSKSNHSGLSPLRSERTLGKQQAYQPYAKEKRLRAKSSKQATYRGRHETSIPVRKPNSRLIPLDPMSEKVYEEILRKQINEKIQNRLQLLTCVFKDVKMRQEKNEIDTLHQRFQIEARARKEVKSIINNDPKILRKHKMVVG